MNSIKKLKEQLIDFTVSHVCIVDNDTFILVANWYPKSKPETYEDAKSYPAKVIAVNTKDNLVGTSFYESGLRKSYSDGGYIDGKKISLTSDGAGNICVYNYENGNNGGEIATTYFSISDVKLIGNHFYAASTAREIYRRNSPHEWEMISPIPNHLAKTQPPYNRTTHCIDGFSETDMYMCGDLGDLWHFDGKKWKDLDPPCNWSMAFLVCASDNKVYIGGEQGQLLVGRNDVWDEVITNKMAFNEGYSSYAMTFFKNKLYIATGYRVSTLVNDKWIKVNDISSRSALETIDSNEDTMIIGGFDKVTLFNGETEEVLYMDNSGVNEAQVVASALINVAADLNEAGDELVEIIESIELKK